MPEFLTLVSPQEALNRLMAEIPQRRPVSETVETDQALGRVTAQAVFSKERLPSFDRSSVDGYAVIAADTYGASDSLPAYLDLVGEISMGKPAGITLKPKQVVLIHTGGMLPAGADAVVMVENTQLTGKKEVEIFRSAAVGENTLHAGEDVEIGDEIVPAGRKLRPAEIGGLLALGETKVKVATKPSVAILSSGDEVVPPDQSPTLGQVRDVNSSALKVLVEQAGGRAVTLGILPDQAEALQEALNLALKQYDMVIITAGSSASTRDLTAQVIQKAGKPGVLVHGVNIKPGKPTILGVCDGKIVIGLPGNPVSALVIAGIFVKAAIDRLLGLPDKPPQPVVNARLTVNVASQAGREDWVPVRLVQDETGTQADPIFFKSNLIFNLARADGLICIPADANGLSANEIVAVHLLK